MGFFETQITAEQIAVRDIKTAEVAFRFHMVGTYMQLFDSFWRNKEGKTPQEMAEAYDIKCAELFRRSEIMRQAINAIDETALPAEYQEPLLPYTVETIDNIPLQNGGIPTGRIIIGG